MTYGELASKHNMTVAELMIEAERYLQCEGYDDAGNEYATLEDWITGTPARRAASEPVDHTPWQKGDDVFDDWFGGAVQA